MCQIGSRFIEDIAGYGEKKRGTRWCTEKRKGAGKSLSDGNMTIGGLMTDWGLILLPAVTDLRQIIFFGLKNNA